MSDGDDKSTDNAPSDDEAKKKARADVKALVKEALEEFGKENAPKQRTQAPKPSIFQQLFGQY